MSEQEKTGVTAEDVLAAGMRPLLGAVREAVEQSVVAFKEAFKDPQAPPEMSEWAKKYPPGLAEYVNNVVVEVGLWEERLKKRFGVEIRYEIDWDGFTGQPERNELALINLKEMGVDWMYYALTGLADSEEAGFATMVRNRVRSLRILRVASAAEKRLTAEGYALVLRIELHKDYSGYLTMAQMKEVMVGLVAGMPEVPREELHAFWTKRDDEAEADERAAEEAARVAEVLEGAKRDAEGALANCAGQLEGIFGRKVEMKMDWESMSGAEGIWGALNASLSPVLAGVMVAAQDLGVKAALVGKVSGILIKGVSEKGAGFALKGKTLVYQAAGAMPGDAMKAAEMIKGLVGRVEEKAVKRGVEKRNDPDKETARKKVVKKKVLKKALKKVVKKVVKRKATPKKMGTSKAVKAKVKMKGKARGKK